MGQLVLTDVYPVVFLLLCSICGTHWGEILYLNFSNIVSNLLKLTFNSLKNSLFAIHHVIHTLSKFILYTTNAGTLHFVAWGLWRALECGLSHNLIFPQLKSIIQCLTVFTSIVCSLEMFSNCQWMLMNAIFPAWRITILHLYFIFIFMLNPILPDFFSTGICNKVIKLWFISEEY